MKLGTAKHHQKYVDKMDSLELPGCFGMTELGHGSNVMVRRGPVNMKRCKSNSQPLNTVEALASITLLVPAGHRNAGDI